MKRAAGAVLFGILFAVPVQAQEPPDSIVVVDSLTALGSPSLVIDSLAPDSLALVEGDTLVADSLSADTIFYNIPRGTGEAPAGFATGIWDWDRHSLMASGANTLAELFQEIPGLITLLGGDYGTPASISAFGLGGAGYRVFRDGFEVYPVDGGVADLQRIGLVGVSRIRLERSMGQMIIELTSYEYDDGRPFSVIEAGTGDLSTNMFRGIYTDPTALGGSLGTGLERMDTRGRGQNRQEGGNRTGSWVRYQVHLQNRFGIGLDLRRSQSQTKVVEYTPTLTRTDVMARAGLRVADGVVVSGYAGRSSLSAEPEASIHRMGGSRGQIG
ncbi:MAG: TonB-dependent receptor plug domain-containing protein, partial [Longimicrobiales bacterium]